MFLGAWTILYGEVQRLGVLMSWPEKRLAPPPLTAVN